FASNRLGKKCLTQSNKFWNGMKKFGTTEVHVDKKVTTEVMFGSERGEYKEDAIRILESCGFHARIGLKVLEQRSLITISPARYDRLEHRAEEGASKKGSDIGMLAVAASNRKRKKSFLSWKQQEAGQRQNFKKGSFQNQQMTARKQDRFTLLTKTPKEILALEKGKFKPPPLMTTLVEERNASKFCEFHGEVGHTTNECMHLKRKIEEMLKSGKLSRLIKELKQSGRKDQAKAAKKG
nr:reverse transcriptase domain-containing protein [Tanacetum cinerariifolium]